MTVEERPLSGPRSVDDDEAFRPGARLHGAKALPNLSNAGLKAGSSTRSVCDLGGTPDRIQRRTVDLADVSF